MNNSFFENLVLYIKPSFDAVCFFLFLLFLVLLIKVNLYKGIINPEGLKNYQVKKLNESKSTISKQEITWDKIEKEVSNLSLSKLQKMFQLKEQNMAVLSKKQEQTWSGLLYLDRG